MFFTFSHIDQIAMAKEDEILNDLFALEVY
jgi:hypothetical protein